MTTRTAHTRRKEDCERDYQQQDQSKLHTEITMFTKSEGPLTKRISLSEDGSVKSDGGACLMAKGVAGRVAIADVQQLATLIEQLQSNQAIALGALRTGLPDQVKIVTKAQAPEGRRSTQRHCPNRRPHQVRRGAAGVRADRYR